MVTDRSDTGGGVLGGFVQLGKYFQLISIVPAALIVMTAYALMGAGAPGRPPTWHAIASAADRVDFQRAVALGFATLIVGMTLHPFQYAATQFLEGYWGASDVARRAMWTRARLHMLRSRRYSAMALRCRRAALTAQDRVEALRKSDDIAANRLQETDELKAWLDHQEFTAAADRYPRDDSRVMPTRLGNTLRRHEDLAGEPYGLDAVSVVPHLLAVATPTEVATVNDARGELDLAVRFVLSWVLVAAISFLLVWPYGSWLLVPLAAYGMAWISYRAAVQAASAYGSALSVLVDLNYEKLMTRFHESSDLDESVVSQGLAFSRLAARQERPPIP
jgi:hypothetical protein